MRNAIASIIALAALALTVLAPARATAAPPDQPIRYTHKVRCGPRTSFNRFK